MRWNAILLVALLGIGAGCTIVDWFLGDPTIAPDSMAPNDYRVGYAYTGRPRGEGNPWVGQQAGELVAALGQPDSILEARPKGASFRNGVHILSYIYIGDRSTRASCIDAYVVAEATGTIVDYYCR